MNTASAPGRVFAHADSAADFVCSVRYLTYLSLSGGCAGFLWITDLGQKIRSTFADLTVITQYISQRQMTTDAKQAQMMAAMPLVIGWMATGSRPDWRSTG